MLKNIHLHVDAVEERQHALEQQAAEFMELRKRQNINAFTRFMPGLLQYVQAPTRSSVSLLCNQHGELNIVDYQTGRVLYNDSPKADASSQVDNFARHPLYVAINPAAISAPSMPTQLPLLPGLDSTVALSYRQSQPLPQVIDVLVILGLGLGHHLEQLLSRYQINHLIVYEPHTDYMKYSFSVTDWKFILEQAQQQGTGIYLQVAKDATELSANIEELSQHIKVDGFYVMQHYSQPIFNQVSEMLAKHSWDEFRHWIPGSVQHASNENYDSIWQSPVDRTQWSKDHLDRSLFNANIEAFKRYFPAIGKEFSDYTPQHWTPLANSEGSVNVFHHDTLASLYGPTPQDDCTRSLDNFAQRPNKDNLVLGYTGQKLRSYLHYQLVEEVQSVLSELEESRSALPDTIKSMIMFGIGVGYQLPRLYADYQVEKLFICEPNRDYFFASLYAINWAEILQQVDDSDGRIYLNIGDDGSHLIHDLLHQFHSIGPHVLASTYFYQGYYNASLTTAIVQLREQLQVIISMGDYFDHSRYGIAHTQWAIANQIPFLKASAAQQLSQDMRETPVFIVGNGPSLDSLLPLIKAHQDQAIIVSCGTALQSLHRNGITPDFHAEIEINRATYDWACRIGDFDYLKNISLISCNGIHPDTCSLYKDTFLAFKEGESATVSITELYPQHGWTTLGKSYPTVTNFAVDFITQAGFEQLYLCGVDMGFVDKAHHHSKSSGYYENGEQVYDYSQVNNTSLVVAGNFRPWVNTKYEFKVSKSVLEQAFSSTRAEVYNLNDGAKIAGAIALQPNDLLILSQPDDVQQAIERVKQSCFETLDSTAHQRRYDARYQHDVLADELTEFKTLLATVPNTKDAAERWVNQQRQFIVDSFNTHKSALYFYLTGTVNYINSAFIKTLNVDDEQQSLQAFNTIAASWAETMSHIEYALLHGQDHYDAISSYPAQRRAEIYAYSTSIEHTYTTQPTTFRQYLQKCQWLSKQAYENPPGKMNGTIVVCQSLSHWEELIQAQSAPKSVVISDKQLLQPLLNSEPTFPVVYLPNYQNKDSDSVTCNNVARVRFGAYAYFEKTLNPIILPKLVLDTSVQKVEDYFDIAAFSNLYPYVAADCIWLLRKPLESTQFETNFSDRLYEVTRLKSKYLQSAEVSLEKQQELRETLKPLLARGE